MKLLVALLLAALLGAPHRSVEKNVLTSSDTPKIAIRVADEFHYVGRFDFTIVGDLAEYPKELVGKVVAAGERFVFASASKEKKVNKLFVVQLEGFLPENDQIYRYRFDNAETIGRNRYRHNAWFYDEAAYAAENPSNEAARTRQFLREKGYTPGDGVMASRFVGLADSTRKNEIIIFYFESMSLIGRTPADFLENGLDSAAVAQIRSDLIARSRKSFEVIDG